MIVVHKNEGAKINYNLTGNVLSFGELTLDLEGYERDFPVHLDICMSKFGFLTMGLSEKYVAQVNIPERQYTMVPDGVDEEGNPVETPVANPFDISHVTLTLWRLEE